MLERSENFCSGYKSSKNALTPSRFVRLLFFPFRSSAFLHNKICKPTFSYFPKFLLSKYLEKSDFLAFSTSYHRLVAKVRLNWTKNWLLRYLRRKLNSLRRNCLSERRVKKIKEYPADSLSFFAICNSAL